MQREIGNESKLYFYIRAHLEISVFEIYRVDCILEKKIIQSNFSGSNTFGTMKISSRQG